jgi:DNA-binding SARP family transcriptional activator/tetratricopeptide (TPR) repeat protein
MAPYFLTCLGPPVLRTGPDADPIRFRTRKHFALLIYLAVEPGIPHRRDRLATVLWGEADVDEARHSLATALSMIRGKLGPDILQADRETVRLTPGRVVTDLQRLEHQDEGDDGPLGPFLEEFDIPDAVDFQQWKDGHHARLLPVLHSGVAERIEQCRRAGDSRRMEVLAHRLQRIDALSEEAVRGLIEARAMAGDRIGALRAFDRWRTRLSEDLGAVPSQPLERLAERLRRGGGHRGSLTLLAPIPTEQWKERIFVGRGSEFRVAYDRWERVQLGEPKHLLLRGESGIGKTMLVERLTTAIALEGASVARAQCHALEQELPFGVTGSLVNLLLELPGAVATPPEQLAELGRLNAKVRQRFPGLPTPLNATGESARILYTEAVMALVAAVAEEHPVVLVVDDIHLADATSLVVLHLMLRRIETLPLMMILTTSNEAERETESSRRFFDNAANLNVTPLDLGPLPESDAREMLDLLLANAEDPGAAIRKAILEGARGNPMILELLLADWQRRGDACLALSVTAMTPRADRPPLEAARRLVDRTLATLDAEARSVVELAAILGQRLNDLSMYMMVDLPVARTMRAMTTLTGHRVLRDAGSHLEFTSDFVRSQCYLGTSAPLRRMLHGQVAERLLLADGTDGPIPGLEIAWHLVRAERLPEAIPYLLAGGRESIRRGAPHEADLALSTGLPVLTGAPRRTAILLLAEARQELGMWVSSLDVLDTAREEFTESEECLREVLRIVARRWMGYIDDSQMSDTSDRLIAISTSEVELDVRLRALCTMPFILTSTRESRALQKFGQSLDHLVDVPLDDYQRIQLLLARSWREDQVRNVPVARALIDEAISLVDSTGTANSVAVRVFVGGGLLRIEVGDYEGAIPFLERAAKAAKQIDNAVHLSFAAAGLAIAHGRLGRTTLQLDWANVSLRSAREDDWGIAVISASYEKALALTFEGRDGEACNAIRDLDQRFSKPRPAWATQAWQLVKADILALSGNVRGAMMAAQSGATGVNENLFLSDFAGIHSRWMSLVAIKRGTEASTLALLRERATELEKYHAKDRAEILAAIAALESRSGMCAEGTWAEVDEKLRSLPEPVSRVMRRLGTLRGGKN